MGFEENFGDVKINVYPDFITYRMLLCREHEMSDEMELLGKVWTWRRILES